MLADASVAGNKIDWDGMPPGLDNGDDVGLTVESDPVWSAEKSGYATGTPVYAESDPLALLTDGSRAMTGALDMGGHSITNLAPSSLAFSDGETVSSAKVQHWDAAYGWGDHAAEGYTDLGQTIESSEITDGTVSNADVAANTFWETAGNAGISAFASKPILKAELAATVRRLLDENNK